MATRKKTIKISADDAPRCDTCAFGEIDAKEEGGVCHFYPPVPITEDGAFGFTFTMVNDDDWCGQYKRKVN